MIKEFFLKQKAKKALTRCFRQSGIYLKFTHKEKDYYAFPKIHSLTFKENHIEYFFTLPLGVDPGLLDKKKYVFRQLFGENIEFQKKNDKAFTFKVHRSGLPSMVRFDFEQFQEKAKKCDIPIIMGVNQAGELNVFDLKKFHHVQITGITNTGKSVYLRAILTALSLHFTPQQIHFYLADLKRTELTLFKKLQHTKKVISGTDFTGLENMLREVLEEVEKRYTLMERYEVAHLDEVNEILDNPFPHVIVMIDEYGLCSENDTILSLVQDLTSIARAANVYLFLSLQRADSTTITGIAKNNLGVRISFKQSNGINAKIAGVEGVEDLKLSEKGRCIMDVGSEVKKIQCPFIDVPEVKKLIKPFIIALPQPMAAGAEKEPTESQPEANELFGVLKDE